MFNCGRMQSFKIYELGLFNNILVTTLAVFNNVQLLSNLFSFSFFLVEDYLLPLIFELI